MEDEKKRERGESSGGFDLTDIGDAAALTADSNVMAHSEIPETQVTPEEARESDAAELADKSSDQDSGPEAEQERASESESEAEDEFKTQQEEIIALRLEIEALKAQMAQAVAQARAEGEIAGRNAMIEAEMKPEEPGVPALGGASGHGRSLGDSIFTLASGAR